MGEYLSEYENYVGYVMCEYLEKGVGFVCCFFLVL